jgi:hypothetical protein
MKYEQVTFAAFLLQNFIALNLTTTNANQELDNEIPHFVRNDRH